MIRGGQWLALCATTLILVVLTITHENSDTEVASAQQASATCTQIVGFSQSMQWYFGGFRGTVGSSWELRWVGGGSIGNWADPNYVGWTDDSNQVDGCASNASSPDRALLNITDDFHSDISYWVTETTAAMNNLRRKYPSVRAIILQPVVGGPGGSQCTFNGSVVRASFNYPYINQAIDQMANGTTVLKGMAPTVRTCADYADNMGHLTDSAKGPIGVTIGNFYNSFSGGGGGPTSTPTRTPTPGTVSTSTPTRTPTAIPTVGAGQTRTVTFDDLTNAGRPLSGQYPAGLIDWGTNQWYLSGPYGSFRTNSIGFNGSGPTSASFSYFSPMRLLQLDAFNGGSTASTVTLSCNGTTATQMVVQPGQTQTIPMGFIGACSSVTIRSTNGWNTNFDNLVLDSGAQQPTPTRTPTATPTNPPSQPTSTPAAVTVSSFTVTFDDTSGQNRVLSGQYPSGVIDWGTDNWYLSGPFGAFTTKSVGFNGTGRTEQSFNLLRSLRLVRLDAYNGGSTTSTVSLTCSGQATVQVALSPRQQLSIGTNWSGTCASIGIGSTNGWDTNFDNMVFDNGASGGGGGGGGSAINFDDLPNPNRPLSGQYPAGLIDWGTNQWYLSGPYGAFRTNSIGFNGSGPTSARFTLPAPRRVTQIDAYNGGSGSSTITLSCTGQPTVSITVPARGVVTISTGWTSTCSSVTVGSTNGWDTNFDNLVLQ
jgi:hypothetical protein